MLKKVKIGPGRGFLLLALCLSVSFGSAQIPEISLIVPEASLQNPIISHAVEDVADLLSEACDCEAEINNPLADYRIVLPDADTMDLQRPSRFSAGKTFPYFHIPQHHFKVEYLKQGKRAEILVSSPSPAGASHALYALLQEKWGFRFVHPEQTVVPNLWEYLPMLTFTFEGSPRFDKKGFHLHTQHPTELTEPLHNPNFPGGLEEIKTYLDWLARNGQNYFEFCLLEGVELETWVPYAQQFVDYAHDRGIYCGVDLSLHMIQQKSFQLVKFPPRSLRSFKNQIRRNLDQLMVAGWDFLNMEFATAEFVGGMEKMKTRLRAFINEEIAKREGVKLIGRIHVVKKEDEIGKKSHKIEIDSLADAQRGVLVHTVMCYAITDHKAPVYESKNLRHMMPVLQKEMQERETWFYPESAYWITFDNSIPLLLLPYLSARLRDIETMERMQVPGHITFSSGWEWGYWLVDWSIARWSWNYTETRSNRFGSEVKKHEYHATESFDHLFSGKELRQKFRACQDLMSFHLVQQEMMKFLTAANPTDELPPPYNKQFEPRPDWRPKEMAKGKNLPEDAFLERKVYQPLNSFARTLQTYTEDLKLAWEGGEKENDSLKEQLFEEILCGLRVNALRARHRVATIQALVEQGYAKKTKSKIHAARRDSFLEIATLYRSAAQGQVDEQEKRYRYPLDRLVGTYRSHTAYNFGYLYPVHELHFWLREEEQIRRGKYGMGFMNIYDIWRIAGFKD